MRKRTLTAIAIAAVVPVLGGAVPTADAAAGTCKGGFTLIAAKNARQKAHDHNGNGFVCRKANPGPGRNAVVDDHV